MAASSIRPRAGCRGKEVANIMHGTKRTRSGRRVAGALLIVSLLLSAGLLSAGLAGCASTSGEAYAQRNRIQFHADQIPYRTSDAPR